MKYEANIYQATVEEHTFWVAESKSLKGCVGQGETSSMAISELEENENEWLETALEVGIPIPPPTSKNPLRHNGKFALRLSPNVHSESCDIAGELGISLNQHFCNAIIAYNVNCKVFLRKPAMNDNDSETDSKIVNFSVNSSKRNTPKVYKTDGLEEM